MESKFDKLMGDSSDPKKEGESSVEYYSTPGHVRHLDFVQPNGEREFISYTLLTGGTLNNDKTVIELYYSTGTKIILRGANLHDLYKKILAYVPKSIIATEKRYAAVKEENKILVFEINVMRYKN